MAYIKYTNIVANSMVLVVDPGVGNGHVVSGKLGHLGAKCLMEMGEGG